MLALRFPRRLDPAALREGARAAVAAFPDSGRRVRGLHWIDDGADDPADRISTATVAPSGCDAALREFLHDRVLDPTAAPPMRQLLIQHADGSGSTLATRVHHALADLTGTFLWLRRQLSEAVPAGGAEPARRGGPEADPSPAAPLVLRRPRRRPPLFFRDRNAGSPSPHPPRPPSSSAREWRTFEISRDLFDGLGRGTAGFTANDALLAAAFVALRAEGLARPGDSLWTPVNLRERPLEGFGNGASRIRVRPSFPELTGSTGSTGSAGSGGSGGLTGSTGSAGTDPDRFRALCRAVRAAVDDAMDREDWAFPDLPRIARLLPAPALLKVVSRHLARPAADYGAAAFSHMARWPGENDPAFSGLESVGLAAPLHPMHALMFAAVAHRRRLFVTITSDPARIGPDRARAVGERFVEALGNVANLGPPKTR